MNIVSYSYCQARDGYLIFNWLKASKENHEYMYYSITDRHDDDLVTLQAIECKGSELVLYPHGKIEINDLKQKQNIELFPLSSDYDVKVYKRCSDGEQWYDFKDRQTGIRITLGFYNS